MGRRNLLFTVVFMVLAVSLSAFLCYFCKSETGKEITILAGFAGV